MPKPMATINTVFSFPIKRYGRHTVYGPQPQSRYEILKSKDTSEHQAEECGKDSGAADDSGKIDMFPFIQEQSSDKEQEPLACITEHGSEDKGVGDGNEPGGVHFTVSRKSVHFYVHFKWFEKFWIFQFGWRLMAWVMFQCGGIFSVNQTEDPLIRSDVRLKSPRVGFCHPTAENVKILMFSGTCSSFSYIEVSGKLSKCISDRNNGFSFI